MGEVKQKIIVIDGGVMTMKSIMAYGSVKKKILDGILPESTFLPPVSYTFFIMCISALKKIGLNEGDKVILACDKTNSFVKFFYPEYKAQRKAMRDDATHIDFKHHFSVLDKFIDQMDAYSDWNVMWIPQLAKGADLLWSKDGQRFFDVDEYDDYDKMDKWYGAEADHIIAYASEYYTDQEVVFVSIDCLSGDTLVRMGNGGSKNIRHIKEGDCVLSFDEKNKKFSSSKVKNVFVNNHHTELFHIYYGDFNKPIKCTGKHRFYTKEGWKQAKDLDKNDILYHVKKKPFPYNNIQNNYKLGYILGLTDGDGHKIPEKQSIHIEMCDIEPLKRTQQYLKDLFNYHCVIRKTKITTGGKQAYKINCHLNYRYDYLIKQYDKKSKNLYRGYCAGFYDAEGCLTESSQQLAIHIDQKRSKRHLYRVKEYLNALDIKISEFFLADIEADVERFVITGENVLRFLNLCKPAIRRKYPNWEHSMMYLQNGYNIREINITHNTKNKYKTYDLNVSPHHNYVVQTNVIVHNCDLDQLCVRNNTKFFTLAQKYKGTSGLYKHIKNGYDTLAKKIEKGDKADNIIPGETDDNSDKAKELRSFIIDLINLPSFVTDKLKPIFDALPDKEIDWDNLPFPASLAKKYCQVFEKDKIITVEQCEKYYEKKEIKKKKKDKEKREEKKREKAELSMRSK